MIQMFPTYQSESATYYVENEIPQGDSAVIIVPAAVGACSFDIDTKGLPAEYSIYVTNSSVDKAINDAADVLWHPTYMENETKDMFVILSAMAGAYKVICTSGNITVKFRGK